MSTIPSSPSKIDPQLEKAYLKLRPFLIAAICLIFSFILIDAFTPAFESHRLHKTKLSQLNFVLLNDQASSEPLLTLEEEITLKKIRDKLENVENSFPQSFKKGLVHLAFPSPLNLSLSILLLTVSFSFLRLGPYRQILRQKYLAHLSLLAPALVLLSFFSPSMHLTLKESLFKRIKQHASPLERATFFPTEKELHLRYRQTANSLTKQQLSSLWNRYLIDLYQESTSTVSLSADSHELSRDDASLLLKAKVHYFKELTLRDLVLPPVTFFPKNLQLLFLLTFTLFWSLHISYYARRLPIGIK